MAEFVVVGFDDPNSADRALSELTRLQKECLPETSAGRPEVVRSPAHGQPIIWAARIRPR